MTAVPISLHVAEDQLEQHLRTWLPDYLGAAVATDPALSRVDAAELVPQTWARADDWDPTLAYESHYLPAVFIVSGGPIDGGTVIDADGLCSDLVDLSCRVVVENTRGGDQIIGCNQLTRLYQFAIRQLFRSTSLRRISPSLVVEAVGPSPLSADQSRGLAFVDIQTVASVCTGSTDPEWLDDPTWGEPPRDPDPDVLIETTEVAMERT